MLWLVRVLALPAMAACLWLTLQKWLNPRVSLAGCGGSEGCTTLLDSRWSNWFSIPVTLLAASLWLAVLLLTLPGANRWLGRTAEQLLAACAVLLLAGALWFGTLMIAVVKVWCPWCASLHVAGLVAGCILLYSTWKASRRGEVGLFCAAGQAGVAGVALLVLGQLFGKAPDTHLITEESPPSRQPAPGLLEPGGISFLNGTLIFSKKETPLLGSGEAKHILAGFSDYTCPACRAQHSDLKALLQSAPGSYALIILPTPLDRSCNPHLPPAARDHPDACALASMALAFWKENPALFPAYHEFLMTAPLPLSPASARQEAVRLAPKMDFSLHKEWIAQSIAANIEGWHQLSAGNSNLPKLLLRDDIVLHGSAASRERFFEIIQETFPASVAPAIPVISPPR